MLTSTLFSLKFEGGCTFIIQHVFVLCHTLIQSLGTARKKADKNGEVNKTLLNDMDTVKKNSILG